MLSPNAAASKDRKTAAKSPTMQHRHFSTIASIINGLRWSATGKGLSEDKIRGIAERFASELAKTNPNFNYARFLKACGLDA